MKMLNLEICTGCGCCNNICPANAIAMKEDEYGFYKPVVDSSKCVSCNLCVKSCPVLKKETSHSKKFRKPECFMFYQDNETMLKSSSAGAFYSIAKEVISNNGVVIGVRFDEEFRPFHAAVTNIHDLEKLRGSKYVQSFTGDIYRICKEYLDDNRTVLFSGTPCQIGGLYSYLDGKDYANLITIDLVCLGSPSYGMFRQYLEREFDISKIQDYHFRDKSKGWRKSHDTIFCKLKDGTVYRIHGEKTIFQDINMKRILLSKACEKCKFSKLPRQGDITLGDFWGIDNFINMDDSDCGLSMILANSERGINTLKAYLKGITRVPLLWSFPYNNIFSQRRIPNSRRNRFFYLYVKYGFDYAYKYGAKGKYDICLMGCFRHKNFGSALTNYSLYKFLKESKYEVYISSQTDESHIRPNDLSNMFRTEVYDKYDIAPIFSRNSDLDQLNDYADTFIVGSDQIWNYHQYNAMGKVFGLSHVQSQKNKIAYAPSLGGDYWKVSRKESRDFSFLLSRFQNISVRDSLSLDLIKDYFHLDARLCVDPVFLLPKEQYSDISSKSGFAFQNYLLVYFIVIDSKRIEFVNRIAQTTNKNIILICDPRWKKHKHPSLNPRINYIQDLFVEDWLYLFKNSNYIITDSFHACCFSVIFQKDFLGIYREPVDRFSFFLDVLKLEDHFIPICLLNDEVFFKSIDYNNVNNILNQHITSSKQWLINAIETPFHPDQKSIYIEDYIVKNIIDHRTKKISLRIFLSKLSPSLKQFLKKMKAYILAYKVMLSQHFGLSH